MPLTKEQEEKLREDVTKIFESPVRATIQTSDIRTGMLSSTGLSEKVHDIMALIESVKNEALEAQRKEIVEGIQDAERKFDGYPDKTDLVKELSCHDGAEMMVDAILSLPQLQVNTDTDETK